MARGVVLSPRTYLAIRIGVAAVFIWAGVAKLMEPRAFARVIYEYGLAPDILIAPLAIGLPVLELVAALGLLLDKRWGLAATSALLVLFLGVLGYAVIQDLDVDCGCFSAAELRARGNVRIAFFRDVGLALLVFYLFVWRALRLRRVPVVSNGAA
jgi:uncharacterized membrane protein YphA (DoxX/SURF4 family)